MKLAIYDFDGTYVSKQTLPLMYKLWKEKHLNDKAYKKIWYGFIWRYVLYKLKVFGWTKRKINPYTMRKTADLFRSIPRDILNQFINDNYQNLQAYIFEPMRKQIQVDKDAGYHIVLLSGNLDIILKPFKKDGFDTIIGSVFEEKGEFLPSDKIHILIEGQKKKALLERFKDADYKNSKAYADNGYDIPILELVGKAYAVNPDKELEDHALKNNWNIIKKDK
ncbi:haloacid dehalogenase-like hydrolase [Mycoplasmatota bacterium]|nr:haloacid dehalogenase-like hydrolase [Mycoplasmatota bacterium]